MNSLKNKVALITGSVRGLGKAIAERYAALGASIVLNYSKDAAAAEEMEKNIKAMDARVIAVQADVSKVADIKRLFVEAKRAFGKIDIVVANAGIGTGMAVYGGSKTTPRYMVNVLAKEIGHRGVTVNSIIPFAVDHSGIFTEAESYPELRRSLIESCPMGRLAEVEDVANIAEFFASDLSSFVNGQHLLVNGGANQ